MAYYKSAADGLEIIRGNIEKQFGKSATDELYNSLMHKYSAQEHRKRLDNFISAAAEKKTTTAPMHLNKGESAYVNFISDYFPWSGAYKIPVFKIYRDSDGNYTISRVTGLIVTKDGDFVRLAETDAQNASNVNIDLDFFNDTISLQTDGSNFYLESLKEKNAAFYDVIKDIELLESGDVKFGNRIFSLLPADKESSYAKVKLTDEQNGNIQKYSKGVFDFFSFYAEYQKGRIMSDGFVLGRSSNKMDEGKDYKDEKSKVSMEVLPVFAKLTKSSQWQDLHEIMFNGDRTVRTEELLQHIVDASEKENKPIIFYLPPDIEKSEITFEELQWFLKDPSRMKNVYFVVGGYDMLNVRAADSGELDDVYNLDADTFADIFAALLNISPAVNGNLLNAAYKSSLAAPALSQQQSDTLYSTLTSDSTMYYYKNTISGRFAVWVKRRFNKEAKANNYTDDQIIKILLAPKREAKLIGQIAAAVAAGTITAEQILSGDFGIASLVWEFLYRDHFNYKQAADIITFNEDGLTFKAYLEIIKNNEKSNEFYQKFLKTLFSDQGQANPEHSKLAKQYLDAAVSSLDVSEEVKQAIKTMILYQHGLVGIVRAAIEAVSGRKTVRALANKSIDWHKKWNQENPETTGDESAYLHGIAVKSGSYADFISKIPHHKAFNKSRTRKLKSSDPQMKHYNMPKSDYGEYDRSDGFWAIVDDQDSSAFFAGSENLKLHISANVNNSNEIYNLVRPVLDKYNVCFKVPLKSEGLAELNDGKSGDTQVGKFMTIYLPKGADMQVLIDLSAELDAILRDYQFRSPEIKGEMKIGESGILYARDESQERGIADSPNLKNFGENVNGENGKIAALRYIWSGIFSAPVKETKTAVVYKAEKAAKSDKTNAVSFIREKLKELEKDPKKKLPIKSQDLKNFKNADIALSRQQLDALYAVADKHHQGNADKIEHILGVAAILIKMGITEPELIAAAFLHDALEDSYEYYKDFPGDTPAEKRKNADEKFIEKNIIPQRKAQVKADIEQSLAAVFDKTQTDEIMEYMEIMTKGEDKSANDYYSGIISGGSSLIILKLADRIYNMGKLKKGRSAAAQYLFGQNGKEGTLYEFLTRKYKGQESETTLLDALNETKENKYIKDMFIKAFFDAVKKNILYTFLPFVNLELGFNSTISGKNTKTAYVVYTTSQDLKKDIEAYSSIPEAVFVVNKDIQGNFAGTVDKDGAEGKYTGKTKNIYLKTMRNGNGKKVKVFYAQNVEYYKIVKALQGNRNLPKISGFVVVDEVNKETISFEGNIIKAGSDLIKDFKGEALNDYIATLSKIQRKWRNAQADKNILDISNLKGNDKAIKDVLKALRKQKDYQHVKIMLNSDQLNALTEQLKDDKNPRTLKDLRMLGIEIFLAVESMNNEDKAEYTHKGISGVLANGNLTDLNTGKMLNARTFLTKDDLKGSALDKKLSDNYQGYNIIGLELIKEEISGRNILQNGNILNAALGWFEKTFNLKEITVQDAVNMAQQLEFGEAPAIDKLTAPELTKEAAKNAVESLPETSEIKTTLSQLTGEAKAAYKETAIARVWLLNRIKRERSRMNLKKDQKMIIEQDRGMQNTITALIAKTDNLSEADLREINIESVESFGAIIAQGLTGSPEQTKQAIAVAVNDAFNLAPVFESKSKKEAREEQEQQMAGLKSMLANA
ncbi:MAG: hypothetical protein FWC57_02335 [Endomicrobia bacterium]|nr:hypothetical protein [Endomicrobiia bacterium]